MRTLENTTLDELVNFALNHRAKMTVRQAFDYMEKAHAENRTVTMLWKVSDKDYIKWYNENKEHLETLFNETLYIVSCHNKAFGNYCGYSIFASSLASKHRNLPYEGLDRIERCNIDWCIPFYDEEYTILKELNEYEKTHPISKWTNTKV